MTDIIEALGTVERERIAALRREQRPLWIDLDLGEAKRGNVGGALGIPDQLLEPLLDFAQRGAPSRTFRADQQHVVFALTCYLEPAPDSAGAYRLRPVEVHVLVSGDYVLTLHEEAFSLPGRLAPVIPEGRSRRYAVYAILDSIVATAFDALYEVQLKLEGLALIPTDMRAGRVRMEALRTISSRLSEMRHRVAPERGIFDRIAVEIGRVESTRTDGERYFELIVAQLNRLVDAIDAAADGLANLIQLRLNETTYWLTVVATIFLPLTFITGFFGMNFGWMVDGIDTQLAFWLLGIGTLVVGVALILRLVVRGSPVEPDS
jgi:magnesium transporter